MGKKFMGYDNASELITAIGNKIKAKYTKPNTGIPKSDLATAVQTSLGKADSAVQPSSLVDVVNNGAKNLLHMVPGVYRDNVATFTVNKDCSVVINSTSAGTSATSLAWVTLQPGTYVFEYDATLTTGACDVRLMVGSDTIRNHSTFTFDSETLVRVDVYSYAINSNVVIKPMLCTETQYLISQAYEPHALGNQILTPALAEVVDNGAKNYACENSASYTTTSSIGGWVIAQQLSFVEPIPANTPVHIEFDYTTSTHTNEDLRLQLTDSQGLTIYDTRVYSTGTDGHISATVVPEVDVYGYTVKFEKAGTATVSNIMICTKAQFDISPVYEPHALCNYHLTPAIIQKVDEGAKNLLPRAISTGTHTVDNVTFTVNSDGSVSASSNGAIAANKSIDYFLGKMSDIVPSAGVYRLFANVDSGAERVKVWFFYTDDWSGVAETFSSITTPYIPSSDLNRNVVVRVVATAGTAISNIAVYPMICTLADWNVSHKRVPYRPDWDFIGKKTLLSNQCIASNDSSFTFDVTDYNSGAGTTEARYRYGLIIGGTSSGNPILYHVFISATNAVTLTKITTTGTTLTGSISNNKLTVSESNGNPVYGGLRLLWLD